MKWLAQILSWASTLVIARLLTPADYGLVGMAAVYIGLTALLTEFGFGASIVTLRTLTERQVAQINTTAVLFGVAAFLASCAAAAPIAWFYREPRVVAIVIALATGFIIDSIRTVPAATLERELRFKLLGVLEGARAVVLAVATVAFAFAGYSYWSLVLGTLISGALYTAAILWQRRVPFAWPRRAEVGPAMTFSRHVLASRLSWFTYSNADQVIAGKVLGANLLGAYTFGWSLAAIAVDKISAIVTRVAPGFFSAVQHDKPALRRYLANLTEGLALATVPVSIGLALVADQFVLLALGETWRPAILPLRLLACYAAFRSIVTILPVVLMVTGEARFAARVNMAAAIAMPIGFGVGAWLGGIVGLATAWLVLYPFVTIPLYQRVFQQIDMSPAEYFRAVWPSVASTALMALAVVASRWAMPDALPLAAHFAASVAAGAVVYASALVLLFPDRVRAIKDTLRHLRGGAE